jgi:pSer/pThr/pTyr-binding forkhead associated (FHA) protein
MYRLTLSFSGQPVRKFNFDQDVVTIGREMDCDVVIDNIGISRRHATIEQSQGKYILTDLKSHNGTFVKGERIYHHQLEDSDEIFIGKYCIQFENLDLHQEPQIQLQNLQAQLAGMQDMTLRLEGEEIQKLMGASAQTNVPKLAQLTPEKERRTLRLDRGYYLIGKASRAQIRIGGWGMPRFAALVARSDKRYHIVALSKWKGIRVNGSKEFDRPLNDGDVVKIGSRKFRFTLR